MTKAEAVIAKADSRSTELRTELESLKAVLTDEKRSAEDVKADTERVGAIEKELKELKEERTKATAELEAAKKIKPADEIKKVEDRKNMDKMNRDSVEYRDAFVAYLKGTATPEQRDALITTGTSGIYLPSEMDTQIWDNIHTSHPILADIDTENTGIVLEVVKHTGTKAGQAKQVEEGAANDDEDNDFVKVRLVGKDYSKTVELSYAAAQMTAEALTNYLSTEIAADLGEALAKDVFAQLKKDLGEPAVTVASGAKLTYNELLTAFGAAEAADTLTVYGSSKSVYGEIYGMVDTAGQPVIRDGVALGANIKVDSAAGDDIFVVDSKKFILNEVSPLSIESDKDIKKHVLVISGYVRAEGTIRDTRAGAYISKAAA